MNMLYTISERQGSTEILYLNHAKKILIIYYLFQHVLWKIFLAVHGQNGRYDLLVGHLELGQQDGTVLGPAPIDDRQLFVGLGLGGALSVLPVIILLFLVG